MWRFARALSVRITEALKRAADALGVVNEAVGVFARNVAGALLGAMVLIVMAQVVFRYGFNNSLAWTEELSKALMVWTAFLVAPWAYRHGQNVAIETVSEALPAWLQRTLNLIITLLVLWICAVFFGHSLGFVARGMQSEAASLPVATGVFYLIVPPAFAALFVVGCEHALRAVAAFADPPTEDGSTFDTERV